MKRKLIKQGAGGYTIYVPKKWVAGRGLKEGDEIDIEEAGTSLFLSTPQQGKRSTEITVSDHDARNVLTHLYRNGYDRVVLHGVSAQRAASIVRDLLMGFEITKQEEGTLVIESISEPAHEQYEVLLRRAFLIIKESLRLVQEGLALQKPAHGGDMDELRTQQDRIILYCRRVLIKESHQRNPVLEWELLTFLMHIQHAVFYLHQYAAEAKMKSAAGIELLKELSAYFDLYYNAFFRKDIACINELNKKAKELQFGKCYRALERAKDDAVILSHIRELFRLVQVGSSPILSMLTDVADPGA